MRPLIGLGLNPDNPIESRRYAVLALANLTATTANHMTIIEDGGLGAFFALCNSPDLMSQVSALRIRRDVILTRCAVLRGVCAREPRVLAREPPHHRGARRSPSSDHVARLQ